MEKGKREGMQNEEMRRASVGNVEEFLRKRRREEEGEVESGEREGGERGGKRI